MTFREKNKTIRAGIPTGRDSCFMMEEQKKVQECRG
jgi:hypothetical protein